jgi:hypothetical protein
MAQIESWKNKNIDGFYTKTTQKGGFSKLCVKTKKRCLVRMTLKIRNTDEINNIKPKLRKGAR